MGDFVAWVQYKPYRNAVAADLPAKTCKEILRECQKGMVEEKLGEDEFKNYPISITSTVVNDSLTTTEGFYKFLQLSITIEHPELSDASEFSKVIGTDGELIEELFKPMMILQGFLSEKDEEESEKNEPPN